VHLAPALATVLLLAGCGDTAGDPGSAVEPNAGTWKTWILASPTQIAVPPPPAPGSPEEEQDRAELARLTSDRTPAVERAAQGWDSRMAIEPWMNLNFELVAARAKDPVAASRAYALLSVAMYDASVAAWNAKYRYDREPPSDVDVLVDAGPDPSYPSEHAVIAAAASRVLAYLYPERPAASYDAMAQRIARSRAEAGASFPSDVRAGMDLGRAVADEVIAYAEQDGSDREWTGEPPSERGSWEPPPGTLAAPVGPLAGTWETWVMESGSQFRPPPFPEYGSPEFRAQTQAVVEAKENLTPEQIKAAEFWAGSEGTALPPGIWNQVVLRYLQRDPPSVPRSARVLALLNVAQADAGIAAWDSKYAYWVTRPENAIQDLGIDRSWEPLIDTPFFPAYVSGHATYSGAAGEVMAHLYPQDADIFRMRAQEAAESRVWGGIHYPLDGSEGLKMGRSIGRLAVERARTDGAQE
jgi:membrane-associated phospholipid phosphatase